MTARPPGHFASPPRRFVVGCDRGEGAGDAVALVGLLAPRGADVLLVDVAPRHALRRQLGGRGTADFPAARAALTARGKGPLAVETRTVRAESPAEVLADIAGDERRDLIVVGSPHRGLFGRALLGSVAKSLLHRSPVPVAVAPRDFDPDPFTGRLAVGFDGSAEARSALEWAEALAAARGGELDIFTVATPPVSIPGALGYRPACVADPFDPIEEAADRAGDEVEIHAHLRVGRTAPNLAAAAAQADLLVVGTRTHTGIEEALIGSVADELANSPRCPIVAVPLRSRPPARRRSLPDGERTAKAKDGAA
jgi:nucleotide-binding universal stress UspA family protein